MLAGASLLLIGLALWMRYGPLVTGGTSEPVVSTRVAILRSSVAEEVLRLDALASAALAAPLERASAFRSLARLPRIGGLESVIVFDSAPRAWAGEPRVRVDAIDTPIAVTHDAFFTVVHVMRKNARARAVASAVIAAEPPASSLVHTLLDDVERDGSVRFEMLAAGDPVPAGAVPVLASGNTPILLAAPSAASAAELRFKQAARARAAIAVVLLLGYIVALALAWRERKDPSLRFLTLGVGLLITGIVPWSEFSNVSRAFDPGFYFSRVGGPYTANAAALLATVLLLLMTAFEASRVRRGMELPRAIAGVLALVTLGAGLVLGSNIVRGVGQPAWGATPGLWLSWELPVFLFLLTVLLATIQLARLAVRKRSGLSLRTVAVIAFIAALAATSALWFTTTRQRMRLAERDLAALTRVDESEEILARRFIEDLSRAPVPTSAADLLRLYASSELSAAEFPVVIETRRGPERLARLDLAPAAADSAAFADPALNIVPGTVTTILGATGVQAVAAAAHPGGEITTVVVLPHTRLVTPPAFAQLLGMAGHVSGDPPYTVTLSEASSGVKADMGHVVWERIGDQWHGDRLIPTSAGIRRAHVEVDLRSVYARGERGILIILLDVLLAGLLWLVGAALERPFPRWLRAKTRTWMRTYRARLTLALFAFFVIPALAFALWSYQRLRSDDRQTRELLVNETLGTVGEGAALANLPQAGERFDTPLFLYSGGLLAAASDPLYAALAPGGIALPPSVHMEIGVRGELTAASEEDIGGTDALFGYRAVRGPSEEAFVLSAPARGDDLVLDRRRRDLGMLVLFATALGAVAALWLSGIAAKRLARDLELSRIEVARAERVIAWGEMARQVAHEIKNPLTPIRLGVQHLRRARKDNRADFDKVLDDNVGRILAEIDRLDSIARSFSRYGSAPADLLPAERLDVSAVVRDVVGLEQMGKSEVKWRLRGGDHPMLAMARADELREVMLNILENARLAGARRVDITLREEEKRVTIEISDDGSGIPASALPRIFEPHFSTRTTGSGLGLASSRRIIDHWGGEIAITSDEGKGARVLVALVKAG